MTAGMQVPLEQTFGKVLERNLNEGLGTAQWEVLNGAVNAFGTDNELLFFRYEGYKYQPDLVVLGVYLANDIYNNKRELDLQSGGSSQKPYFVLNDSNELVLMNFPPDESTSVPVQLASFLKKHLQVTRFAAQILQLRHEVPGILQPLVGLFGGGRGVAASSPRGEDNRPSGDICDEEYSAEIEEAWAITRALIKQLRVEVEGMGAGLAVLVIPASPQLIPPFEGGGWYCERPNQEFSALINEEGIPSLDLLMPFREQVLAGTPDLYYAKDFHMNQAGHRVAGELLAEFVGETMISDGDG